MIILIGSQKGGVGKSTLALNISALLAQRGKDVMLVDADRQGTVSEWVDYRNDTDLPPVQCVRQYDNIHKTLSDLNKRYEFVVVDTAGNDSRELRTGLVCADILITPFKPSQADLNTLPHLNNLIEQARDLNPALKAYGIISMNTTHHQVHEDLEARDLLADIPSIQLLTTVIHERKIYRECMAEGRGVAEMQNEKAKQEIEGLIKEVLG